MFVRAVNRQVLSILDIIHCLVSLEQEISETACCFRLQVAPTQLDQMDRNNQSVSTLSRAFVGIWPVRKQWKDQVLISSHTKNGVFWDVTPCGSCKSHTT
jgi:hypothetical protein